MAETNSSSTRHPPASLEGMSISDKPLSPRFPPSNLSSLNFNVASLPYTQISRAALWPVMVDPLTSNLRAKKRAVSDHADGLADGLFGVWRENAEKVGVIEPSGRG